MTEKISEQVTEQMIEQMMVGAIEKRLGDLERRHDKTRDDLISLVSVMVAALAVALFNDHIRPASGIYTDIIVFLIAYAILKRVTRASMGA